ncbi:hypothetical protein [Streptomyces sp. NPDC001091]
MGSRFFWGHPIADGVDGPRPVRHAGDGVDVALTGADTPKRVGSGRVGRPGLPRVGTPRGEWGSYDDRVGDPSGCALGVADRTGGVERALPQGTVQDGGESWQAVVDALLALEEP